MNEVDKSTGVKFWGALLEHLIENGRGIPKFQVERAVGPILGLFLDNVVSRLLDSDVVTLAAEFPLRKPNGGFQSTNIDWLMYDKGRKELIALELKTDSASFRGIQFETYLELVTEEAPWKRLKEDFYKISVVSTSGKYKTAKEVLVKNSSACEGIDQAPVKVLYIAPEYMNEAFLFELGEAEKKRGEISGRVEFRSFESLRDRIAAGADDEFARYRDMFCEALCVLDKELYAAEEWEGRNYRERIPLDLVLERCRGDKPISIGFKGGETELRRMDMGRLEKRFYKWDWADAADGGSSAKKIGRNWIDGTTFVEAVEAVRSRSLRSEANVRQFVSSIDQALRADPELTFGQIIARIWPDTAASLEEVADGEFIEALKAGR